MSLAFRSTMDGAEFFVALAAISAASAPASGLLFIHQATEKVEDGDVTTVADEVTTIFAVNGQSACGEDVSQLDYALQAACRAQQAGAGDPLTVAALLHDIGHLIEEAPEDVADLGIDAKHEELGHAWLSHRFHKRIFEPAYPREGKGYLCATDPSR